MIKRHINKCGIKNGVFKVMYEKPFYKIIIHTGSGLTDASLICKNKNASELLNSFNVYYKILKG